MRFVVKGDLLMSDNLLKERQWVASTIKHLLARYPTAALRCLTQREWRIILDALGSDESNDDQPSFPERDPAS